MAWNDKKNELFYLECITLGRELEEARSRANRIKAIWTAENVNASPAFVDNADLTTTELQQFLLQVVQGFITLMNDKEGDLVKITNVPS